MIVMLSDEAKDMILTTVASVGADFDDTTVAHSGCWIVDMEDATYEYLRSVALPDESTSDIIVRLGRLYSGSRPS